MHLIKFNSAFFLIVIVLMTACKDDMTDRNKSTEKPVSESLVKANRYLVKQEKEAIENYIHRHGWQMQKTGSGLRYEIVEKGSGPLAKEGEIAVLQYTTSLITGDLVYSSAKDGLKTFVVGHGGVESGLEEAILLMRQGDTARLIIPSHLAFGLLGDDKKIPPHATLIYEIKLIELK